MKKTPIKISSRKAKGRNLQKWVCEQLSNLFNIPWGYEDEKEIQPRIMGQSGVDIVLRGKAAEGIPWSIECKAQEKLNFWDAIKQAKTNCKKNNDWVVMAKRNNQKPVAIIDAETFFYLIHIFRLYLNDGGKK